MGIVTESCPMVVCHDVHKWYGASRALKGISISVPVGQVVVVV